MKDKKFHQKLGIVFLTMLGGLVGTLPAVASIFLLEYIFGVLYALVPLAAYWGYKRAGGSTANRWAMPPLMVSAILCIALLTGVLLYQIAVQEAIPESLGQFFRALVGGGVLPHVIDYSVDAVLFLVLGIWLAQHYVFLILPGKKRSLQDGA